MRSCLEQVDGFICDALVDIVLSIQLIILHVVCLFISLELQ